MHNLPDWQKSTSVSTDYSIHTFFIQNRNYFFVEEKTIRMFVVVPTSFLKHMLN